MPRLKRWDRPSRHEAALQEQPNTDGAGQFTRPTAAQLRGDLDWVVMHCLEKDRARRYESAAALAADVERHLAHEPVVARPPNAGYTLQKLIRRHRGAFAAAGAIAAVLVIGAAVSTWQAIRATRAEHEQGRLRSAAEAQERTSRRRAYAGDMNVVQQALADGNLGRAQTLLNRQRPKPGETDLRDWEWRYLWQFCQGDSHSIVTKRPESFSSIAASSDGKWLAAGPTPIIIWKRQTGASEEIATPGFTVTHVAFSPREPILALAAHSNSAARFRQVILWSVDQRQIIRSWTISPNGNECTGLFFSEDGRTLATSMASAENEIGLWRVPTGEKLRTFPTGPTAGQPRYSFFAVTDDVKLAAYISREDYHVHVLDLATGEKLWSKGMGTEWVTALRFSPDGKILAVGERAPNCTIRLCDAVTGVELGRLEGHRRTITQLVFWPDGQTLASASWDHTARLWDVSGRRPVRTFRGHTGEVHSLALLPDNRTLVTGSKNGELLQWDTSSDGPGAPALTTIPGDTVIWRFSGDGSTIVTLGRNGRVAERRGENYREEKTLLQLDAKSESQIWPAESITIGLDANVDRHRGATLLAADGPRLAHISAAGNIEVWDWEQGERVSIIVADESAERLAPLGFTDKGEKLTLFRYVPRVRATREEWDVASGRRTRSWPTTGAQATPMKPVVFAPDQKYFISIVGTSVLVRTDLDSDSKAQVELDFRNFVPRGGFSPDGSLVAVPTWNGLVHIVNVDPLRSVAILSGFTAAIHSATFSPNGRRLATGSGESETMMLWDVGSYERVLTLQTERPQFRQAAFRADGNVLGALAGVVPRTALHLWRAPSWLEIETAESAK